MNYQHMYHAGNFADVVKHLTFILIIDKFRQKESPFLILDTHAGQGLYDLQRKEALKTREALGGILKIWCQKFDHSAFQTYFKIIQSVNLSSALQFYPGSPYIAWQMMRPQDRLLLSDLNLQCIQMLKNLLGQKKVQFQHQNGYQSLKACLPPMERRGIVLIDPAFEDPQEFDRLAQAMKHALKRFERGVYIIWYPMKDEGKVQNFLNQIQEIHTDSILNIKFQVAPASASKNLFQCGLTILNPPWQFEQSLELVMTELFQVWRCDGVSSFKFF